MVPRQQLSIKEEMQAVATSTQIVMENLMEVGSGDPDAFSRRDLMMVNSSRRTAESNTS